MKIEDRFVIAAPPERVWAAITDPQQMAPCIPGCSDIRITGPNTYWAEVTVKVGPISAKFGLEVEVVEEVRPSHVLSVTRGEEGSRASIVSSRNELRLFPKDDGATEVFYAADVSVTGRLGKFGLGVMKKKAASLAEEFVVEFRSRVEAMDSQPAAPTVDAAVAESPPVRRSYWSELLARIGAALRQLRLASCLGGTGRGQ
jgi:uncharacterized protein